MKINSELNMTTKVNESCKYKIAEKNTAVLYIEEV